MLVKKLLLNVGELDKEWVVDIIYDASSQASRWVKQ
jgi:hypothetical protein